MEDAAEILWLSRSSAAGVAPGISEDKLDALRRVGAGPAARVLSDGEVIYDELVFRRWLESTVDPAWVYGPFGAHRPPPNSDRRYTYQDASLEDLRSRVYIDTSQLLAMLPGMTMSNVADQRRSGVGPRLLRPTPKTLVYVADEALWWARNVPTYSARHERGVDRNGVHRSLLTPPISRGVRPSDP